MIFFCSSLAFLFGLPTFLFSSSFPDCVFQSCAFRDAYDEFWAKGAEVIGVSPGSPQVHAKFSRRFMIQYPILSDGSNKVRDGWNGGGPARSRRHVLLGDGVAPAHSARADE